jgi:hypothetical protein
MRNRNFARVLAIVDERAYTKGLFSRLPQIRKKLVEEGRFAIGSTRRSAGSRRAASAAVCGGAQFLRGFLSGAVRLSAGIALARPMKRGGTG